MAKNNLEKIGFIPFYQLQSIMEGSQARGSRQEVEKKKKNHGGILLTGLLYYFSYLLQAYLYSLGSPA